MPRIAHAEREMEGGAAFPPNGGSRFKCDDTSNGATKVWKTSPKRQQLIQSFDKYDKMGDTCFYFEMATNMLNEETNDKE